MCVLHKSEHSSTLHVWQVYDDPCRARHNQESPCPVLQILKNLVPHSAFRESLFCDAGMVKRIRGVAYSMKVSPQNTNRMVGTCDIYL